MAAVALFDAGAWALAYWPDNPVRQFQLLFCGMLSVALARNIGGHVRFLEWFHNSG